jgi:hypothetical protein
MNPADLTTLNNGDREMQAITVKYIGPSNTKPSRLKATAANGLSVTVSYDNGEDTADYMAYNRAARALKAKLGWTGEMVAGATEKGGTMVYVFVSEDHYRI